MPVKIAPAGTNMIGYYRQCQGDSCKRLVPCPYIRCQDCRKDFAIKDYVVPHVEPEEMD